MTDPEQLLQQNATSLRKLDNLLEDLERQLKARTAEATIPSIIYAGVNACHLALQTIMELGRDSHPQARSMVAAAQNIFKSYGLELPLDDPRLPAEAAAPAEPFAEAPSVPLEEIPLKETLLWPPPAPVLPPVYTENFYVVRSLSDLDPVRAAREDNPITESPRTSTQGGIVLTPDEQLVFLGQSQWSTDYDCWEMRMRSIARSRVLWVYSKALKPGDEIPKVIDAATQAKSNDP